MLTLALTFVPWFATKCANWKLKSIKAESRKNPVETLQSEYHRREESLQEQQKRVESFNGQVLTFESKMQAFGKQYLELGTSAAVPATPIAPVIAR